MKFLFTNLGKPAEKPWCTVKFATRFKDVCIKIVALMMPRMCGKCLVCVGVHKKLIVSLHFF